MKKDWHYTNNYKCPKCHYEGDVVDEHFFSKWMHCPNCKVKLVTKHSFYDNAINPPFDCIF